MTPQLVRNRSATCMLLTGWLLAIGAFAPLNQSQAAESRKPNIIFILADDLGYGDIGAFGQKKIRTPNLDRLAKDGMRFTQHYSGNAVCAPSRCVLMTGKHPGRAFVRNNQEVQPEGQAAMPGSELTLAEALKEFGYVTGAFGKWGLGPPGSEGDPLRQGFDRFYGYNCQRQAHNYYPAYLWDNAQKAALKNPDFSPHQKLPGDADPNDPAAYGRYQGEQYSPDLIMEEARRFVRENRDKPFFLYVPSTVPHLALQVPEDSLEEYAGQWPETPYPGGRGYLPHRTPRAAYAAMITRFDREIGRLLDLVRELGLERDTIVIFTSDNGPVAGGHGGTDGDFFNSAGGLRGRKGSLYEGGIRVPLIVAWPGRIRAGSESDRVTGFEDWLPTLLELAGGKSQIPEGIDGISFAPTLLGQEQEPRPFLYREFPASGGQQMARIGNWKAVRTNLSRRPDAPIQLYDLKADPREQRDLAAKHPEIVAKLEALMREQHVPSEMFPFPALDRSADSRTGSL